jgi:DNA-binding MarR family transcriptional regulator
VTIQFKPVSADNVSLLKSTLHAVDAFIGLRKTMPLQYVRAFMLVATDEGRNVTEYAKRAGITPSLMTRHLADLGEINRYHKPGFGLVEQFDDPMDRRNRLMRLTAKGQQMVQKICKHFMR